MTEIFFDTNIIIDALAKRPQALAELRRASRPWISRVTWIEILAGVPAPAQIETEHYLANYSIKELTPEIARRAADMRFNRRSLKLPDAVIFASAQDQGAILVTRNAKDFPAVMPGIRIPYTLKPKA